MVLELGRLEKFICKRFNNLVRIGNISSENPNHFWNALFYAFKEYRDMSFEEKMNYIKEQRIKLSEKIIKKDWISYSDGFHSNHNILYEFGRIIVVDENSVDNVALKIFQNRNEIIDHIISEISDFDNIKTIVNNDLEKHYDILLSNIEKKENKIISSTKKQKCKEIFQKYINNVWQQATDNAFIQFKHDIKDTQHSIEFFMLPFILSNLNLKTFFIDNRLQDIVSLNEYYESFMKSGYEQTGHTASNNTDIISEDQTYIVLLFHPDTNTYESLGQMFRNKEDNQVIISRLFNFDDEIIQICFTRLTDDN